MLARQIWELVDSRRWGSTPLTVARVPTGMKAGVSKWPWGVETRPRRAREVGHRAAMWKARGM